ncbi:MAG: hybrid sensor histidine kinase/response regulator [Ignavibacteriaceae bacterium]|nr:hybrid sensor histidine kinase/response regulator [Ignavibacteriaceae bacterium]
MSKQILVVEDSLTQLEQLKYILEQNNYLVKTASNGLLAQEILQREAVDLVISDILMPEMDGYELCNWIKSNQDLKETAVMLLTSLSDPKDVIRGLQAGADNFLTKPYNEHFLISRISYILLNKEIRRTSHISDAGIDVFFGGQKYFINSDKMQIIDLLLSTYENAIHKNGELAEANKQLMNMHREIAKKNLLLEKLNEDKNKFLRIAAHDLRNPISAILSFSTMLIDDVSVKMQGEQKEFLEIIRQSSEFMLQLLNELLDIAVIESGNLILNTETHDLVKVIADNVSLNRVIAGKKKINLDFSTTMDELNLIVDRIKIEQILNNLISNAIKYSFPESNINISLSREEKDATITITDRGQGIPPEDMPKLFQPFAKRSPGGTAGEKSTGLGLSIVKKIIEAHNGKITAESTVGEGSVFKVYLPIET